MLMWLGKNAHVNKQGACVYLVSSRFNQNQNVPFKLGCWLLGVAGVAIKHQ